MIRFVRFATIAGLLLGAGCSTLGPRPTAEDSTRTEGPLRFAPARNAASLLCARRNAQQALRRWLEAQALGHVHLTLEARPPRRDAPSGKVRAVVVEAG